MTYRIASGSEELASCLWDVVRVHGWKLGRCGCGVALKSGARIQARPAGETKQRSLQLRSGIVVQRPSILQYLYIRRVGIMAARNRPRGGLPKDETADAHEERTMWNAIVSDLRKLQGLHSRAAEVTKLQVELERKMGKCSSSISLISGSSLGPL